MFYNTQPLSLGLKVWGYKLLTLEIYYDKEREREREAGGAHFVGAENHGFSVIEHHLRHIFPPNPQTSFCSKISPGLVFQLLTNSVVRMFFLRNFDEETDINT